MPVRNSPVDCLLIGIPVQGANGTLCSAVISHWATIAIAVARAIVITAVSLIKIYSRERLPTWTEIHIFPGIVFERIHGDMPRACFAHEGRTTRDDGDDATISQIPVDFRDSVVAIRAELTGNHGLSFQKLTNRTWSPTAAGVTFTAVITPPPSTVKWCL